MKRIFIFVIGVLFSVFSYANENIIGTWKLDSCEITFTNDSLFIDEIGNEGNGYTYKVIDDYIIYQSEIDKLYDVENVMKIIYVDNTILDIRFDNDETLYEYTKKVASN